jgi:tRNA nucleotidyltransferase/poly(A) polymerase
MRKFKEYLVGGAVRDEILGYSNKDLDYVFVFEDLDENQTAEECFNDMYQNIQERGEIFLSTPSCYTIRYKDKTTKEVKDVVMARKEVGYIPNTRQPIVVPGTLYDDLIRRDFTLNAMAKDEDGSIIDMFDGMWALEQKILITPLDSRITMLDDPIRLMRSFRFSITKGFTISPRIWETLLMDSVVEKLEQVVSQERIRDEVYKMMKHDTLKTLELFERIRIFNPKILDIMFGRGMWLKPTTEL